MNATCRACQPRGFVMVIAIVLLFLVATFAVIVGRLAMREFDRERQAAMEACATQVIASAAAWSRRHVAEIGPDAPRTLSIDELLPHGTTGKVELRRAPASGGVVLIECQVHLKRAGRLLNRRVEWPMGADSK